MLAPARVWGSTFRWFVLLAALALAPFRHELFGWKAAGAAVAVVIAGAAALRFRDARTEPIAAPRGGDRMTVAT